jgi:predicted DNA-binding protein
MSKRIVLTLSDDMHKELSEKAKKVGVTAADYIRHLIIKDKENK